MGAVLSLNGSRNEASEPLETSNDKLSKRQRLSSGYCGVDTRLIPSLPDEVSLMILARLPRICYLNTKLVSRAWRAAIVSPELYNLRKELGKTEEWLYLLTKVGNDKLLWYAIDPIYRKWQRLPLMPHFSLQDESRKGSAGIRIWDVVGSTIKIADVVRGWLGGKDEVNRVPFSGCAVGAVDGCLYMLGGFSKSLAVKCVWRYDPVLNMWSEANSMSVGRAYCKTGILNNKLYVVGGVTGLRGRLTPLLSAEVFDPKTETWSEIPSMPFSKAQVLPDGFLADLLKPVATGMVPSQGRLFVPQSLYCWPFFVDVGGEVYDPEINSWGEMPSGMGDGWPARQAGTKLSVTIDGELYALDPSSSPDSCRIKMYDIHDDAWKAVAGDFPIHDFADSDSPHLLAGLLGKLHVITQDANHNIAVLQRDVPNVSGVFPTAPSSSSPNSSVNRPHELVTESSKNIWRVIASKNLSSTELVSCQTLDV